MSNVVIDPFTLGGAPPASDYPVIESIITSETTTAATSHDVPLPASLNGKLAVIVIRTGRNPAEWIVPADWTTLVDMGTFGGGKVVYRVCDGTEGGTVTFNAEDGSGNPQSVRYTAVAHRIGGAATGAGSFIEAQHQSISDDPPSLTPSWGSAKNLWITYFTSRYADWEVTALPSGYASAGAIMNSTSITSSTSSGIVMGQRDLEAASEDPSAYTWTQGASESGSRAGTIAVRPAA